MHRDYHSGRNIVNPTLAGLPMRNRGHNGRFIRCCETRSAKGAKGAWRINNPLDISIIIDIIAMKRIEKILDRMKQSSEQVLEALEKREKFYGTEN
jgi:hypothetical protein